MSTAAPISPTHSTATRTLLASFSGLCLAGCAITAERFEEKKYSLSDADVCRAVDSSGRSGNRDFARSVVEEYGRRGLSSDRCQSAIQEQNANRAAVAALVVLAGAAIAVSRSSGGYAPAQSYAPASPQSVSAPVFDYEWEWDQFNNALMQPVWACRGVQTGQFAVEQRCIGKLKLDWKWPGLPFRS